MNFKVMVSGGGTGGHIFPAIAVAQSLRQRQIEVCYLGKKQGMEEKIASDEGLAFYGLDASGLLNKHIREKIRSLVQMFKGIFKARKILKDKQIDLVFATGGYVSMPAIIAAWTRGLPVVLHEQNAFPGLVNRVGSLFAKKVCLTFAESGPHLWKKNNVVETGLPIRQAFLTERTSAQAARDARKILLVVGGSQGARPINDVVVNVLGQLLEMNFSLIFLTGQTQYDNISKKIEKQLSHHLLAWVEVMPFCADMARLMKQADLLLGRAGASVIAEMNASGLPGILVPFPQAASNHQLYNARAVEKAGAAVLIEQDEWNEEALLDTLERMTPQLLEQMGRSSIACARPMATEHIVSEICDLL